MVEGTLKLLPIGPLVPGTILFRIGFHFLKITSFIPNFNSNIIFLCEDLCYILDFFECGFRFFKIYSYFDIKIVLSLYFFYLFLVERCVINKLEILGQ